MNALIVEDSRFLRISNERALQKAGYDVITAADSEEGLWLALERKPDLVILDLMLMKLPGYEVLRELRKRPETATMPVMIVSSLPQSNDQKLLDQGATSYFEKLDSCWTRALISLFKTCARCSPKPRPPASTFKFSLTLPIHLVKRRGDHLNILIVDDSRLLRLGQRGARW
jgi:DNA-binding response OmpR family regulator